MSEIAQSSVNLQLYPAGSVLIPEGGKLGMLFVLRDGELEVSRDGMIISTVAQPGAVFGEMSVLLDTPHSATVRALTDVEVFVIANALDVLETRPAWTLQLARLLAQRVYTTTAALVATQQGAEIRDNLVLPDQFVAMLGDPQL